MKALCLKEPFKIELIEKPEVELEKGEVLIKVSSVAICGSDIHAYAGKQAIFDYPRVIGHEICGVVRDVCEIEKDFEIEDKVIVMPYANCGTCIACRKGKPGCCRDLKVMGVHVDGGVAEYIAVPEKYVLKVNANMNIIDACLVEPFAISAHAVHNAKVQQGENVLIIGIGPIGMGAAEIAQTYGATVFVSDVSEARRIFAKEVLGYEHVLNPLDESYGEELSRLTNGDMPDTIIDATGNGTSMSNVFQYLSAGGKVVYVGISPTPLNINHVEFHKRQTELYGSRAATQFDFEYVIECIENGKIHPKKFATDVIDFDGNVESEFKRLMDKKSAMFKGVIRFE